MKKKMEITREILKPNKLLGVRHVQVIMMFLGMVIAYGMRVNLSIAIVAMTDPSNESHFDWSIQTQSVILSSYFWGYILLQIPGGEAARRFGGSFLITLCLAVNSAVCLLLPLCSYYGGWQLVCACRVVQGLFQGFLFPSVHALLAKWVPLEEKGFLGTLVYAGAQLGTALQLATSGFIADYFGWAAIFYVNGAVGAIWTVLYLIVGSSAPENSKIIGVQEKMYIQNSLGHVGGQKKIPTPWKSLFTSVPLLALVIASCGFSWGFWTLMTETPTYMRQILGVDIKTNGVMSAMPFLAMYIMSFPFGLVSDYILKKNLLSITASRKLSNSIGNFGPGLVLIGLAFVSSGSLTLPIVLLTIAMGLKAGCYTGFLLVHLDMAPNFAGPMMGITNSLSNVVSIIAPITAGFILKDETNPADWRNVFFLSAAVYFGCNLFYVIFGSSKTQDWNDDPESGVSDNKGLGVRHVQTLLLFLGMLLAFTMRVNMSIAIVAMTSPPNTNVVTFEWSHSVQSVILSSFFWGYVILQIPGGELSRKIGGKWLFTISVSVNSLLSLLLPLAASLGGWKLVCACRFLQGLTQAFVYPSTHTLISQWVPVEEKGLLGTIIYAGAQLGIAVQLLIGGFISSSWGWPAIFYLNGTMGAAWTVLYLIFGSAAPEQSRFISEEELLYIQKSLGRVGEQKRHPTPWKSIMTCLPFWAVIVAHCGQNWGFFTLMTEMPSYMGKVLGFEIKSNGVLSALPYLAMYIGSFPMGSMTDLILRKKWLTVTNARKLSNSIGLWGPAIALIGLSYTPADNMVLAVALLTVTVGINSGHYTGYLLVHTDLAPNFSGSLMGITNFLANIISIIAPLVCGFIINDEENPLEWRKVFFIASAVYFFCNLFFVLFATSEKQPWNDPDEKTETDVEMNGVNNTTQKIHNDIKS